MDEFVQRTKSLFHRQPSKPIHLRNSYRTTQKLLSVTLEFQFTVVIYPFPILYNNCGNKMFFIQ